MISRSSYAKIAIWTTISNILANKYSWGVNILFELSGLNVLTPVMCVRDPCRISHGFCVGCAH